VEELNFFTPKSVDEVKNFLSKHDNCKLLAGGTDLLLEIRREQINLKHLIDMGHVSELKEIYEDDLNVIIGSMVTFSQLNEHALIKRYYHSLFACSKNMGSPQIRNMATVGGNIVNAQAAADIIPCIMSLNGVLVFESIRGIREVNCENYFNNYAKEKINEDELLTHIIIPKSGSLTGYYKLGKRNALAIARMIASVSISLQKEVITDMTICLGAVGKFPFRVKEVEALAIGKPLEWLTSEEPLRILEGSVYESIKNRKSMPFKKEAVIGVYKEAINHALVGGGVNL